MRYLLPLAFLALLCTSVQSEDLKVELKRLSGTAINAANVRYTIERFDENGNLVSEAAKIAAFTAGVATIPLDGTAANPLRVTVKIGNYTPIALEPLNPERPHQIAMIVNRVSSAQYAVAESVQSQRRVLGDGSLRLHLADEASTVFDPQSNTLEVLTPVASTDVTYDVYRSERGGKWAISKNIHVKCVLINGTPCWKTMGVPVWRTDDNRTKWIFRGYMQQRHSSVVVKTIESPVSGTRTVFD